MYKLFFLFQSLFQTKFRFGCVYLSKKKKEVSLVVKKYLLFKKYEFRRRSLFRIGFRCACLFKTNAIQCSGLPSRIKFGY